MDTPRISLNSIFNRLSNTLLRDRDYQDDPNDQDDHDPDDVSFWWDIILVP